MSEAVVVACPKCREPIGGEWFDGSEIRCWCGALLVAVELTDDTWRFDVVKEQRRRAPAPGVAR